MQTEVGHPACLETRWNLREGGRRCHDDLCSVVKSVLHRINVPNGLSNISSRFAKFLKSLDEQRAIKLTFVGMCLICLKLCYDRAKFQGKNTLQCLFM